jgi:hypothetical protein
MTYLLSTGLWCPARLRPLAPLPYPSPIPSSRSFEDVEAVSWP